MESARGFLLLALAFISFLLYQEWQEYKSPKQPIAQPSVSELAQQEGLPSFSDTSEDTGIPIAQNPSDAAESNLLKSRTVTIKNNVLTLKIDTLGGDVVRAVLSEFQQFKESEEPKVVLIDNTNGRTFIAKSGLIGSGAPDSESPRANYQLESLTSNNEETVATLRWVNNDGVVFDKIFRLKANDYTVSVEYKISNNSDETLTFQMFNQFNRDRVIVNEGNSFGLQAYTGAAYSSDETRYEKYDFDDMDDAPLNLKTRGGWVAYMQHYFLAAWVPNQENINQISTQVLNNKDSIIRVIQQSFSLGPQSQKTVSSQLYIGPKNQDVLETIADGLDLTVDYGFVWWIGQPIFFLLTLFQSFVVNWGLAIILVTVTVKALLYPLASAQYRSFAKMRMLQPKLMQLKERFGDDRQKMSAAMMELYKKEKVNPMGGCLPLLIQMPVFLALYWVLMESYEIRHAPFILWIDDLASKDPYFVLPVLMGLSMWGMQKLQPTAATMDPMQQKIMQFLPVVMTAFMAFFPSGLVLYWLVNNVLSIVQQLYITNKVEKQYANKKA